MPRGGVETWTDTQIATLRRLWAEGLSVVEIGWRMGISKNAVVGKVHRLNLAARPSPLGVTMDPARKGQVAALLRANLTGREVAARLGLSAKQVYYVAERLGLSMRSAAPSALPVPGETPRPVGIARRNLRGAITRVTMRAPTDGGTGRLATVQRLVPTPPVPLAAGGCRWPLWGNERPTQRFCGEARRDVGCPYCPTHAARAFQPMRDVA